MAIEMVDFPIEHGGSFHSYVNVYQRVTPDMDPETWTGLDLRACLEFRGWLTRSKSSRATPQEHWDCRGPSLRFFLGNRSFHRVISSSCKMQWSKGAPGIPGQWMEWVCFKTEKPGPTHLDKMGWTMLNPSNLSLSRFPHLIYLLHISYTDMFSWDIDIYPSIHGGLLATLPTGGWLEVP